MRGLGALFLAAGLSLAAVATPRAAEACGGCTYGEGPIVAAQPGSMRATSVMDHRMVLALSSARTTLWDQIRFAGDPKQFLWILPVTAGARVEIAVGSNAFIDALDDVSAPTLLSPIVTCSDAGAPSYTPQRGTGAPSPNTVTTASSERSNLGSSGRASVGPYAAELVRGEVEPLSAWLRARAFAVSAETESVIRYYEERRSDFVVVQFRPGASVQQMQPIRVSTEGYNPVLPLRFAAIGAGDNVGISLMVLAPTAMTAERWPTRVIENSELSWSFALGESDYRAVLSSTFDAAERPWIIESTSDVSINELLARIAAVPMQAAPLPRRAVIPADCRFPDELIDPLGGPELDGGCAEDACVAGDDDASAHDAATGDAASDPRCSPPPPSLPEPSIAPMSDPANLVQVMSTRAVLTRMHIRLGRDGFARDLTLGAAESSMNVPVIRALTRATGGCSQGGASRAVPPRARGCECSTSTRTHGRSSAGGFALALAAAIAVTARRQPRRR
jgi:hypothetical protein